MCVRARVCVRALARLVPSQDKNGDGSITHAEFIKGLRENAWIAELLGHVPHPTPNP